MLLGEMADLPTTLAAYTRSARELVEIVGYRRAAEIVYHTADSIIAEGHARGQLPKIAPKRETPWPEPVQRGLIAFVLAAVWFGIFLAAWRAAAWVFGR